MLLLSCIQLFSQNTNFKSIMQQQSEKYSSYNFNTDAQFDSLRVAELNGHLSETKINAISTSTCVLNKRVLGWHPYWVGSTYTNYQWNLLSDLVYFDYTVSSSTGNNTNSSFAWSTASVVTVAKANGTKIHICATMFSSHSTFWASSSAQTTFINNIVSLLNARGGNGVNIDFEGMGGSDNAPFVTFMTNLNNALNTANPAYQLSVCLYSVDWSTTFNIPALNNIVDFYTIMGYDYYYSGSAQAGPTSPLYNYQTGYNYTVSKSITAYIKAGATPSKILMGLPYYGREWEVATNTTPANTTGAFNSSRTLDYVATNTTTYSAANKKWEANCYSPYYAYLNGTNWRHCFIDDVYSLGRKYDMVNQRGLGGIGIWALGYDNTTTAYWTLIQNKFSNCAPIVCNDSIFDMGGPTRNYYDNEKYNYTLSAPTGSLVKLQFKSFNTEQSFDSLSIYNGTSTLSPLIGSYTGTNSPGIIVSSGQYLTLKYKSDGSTNFSGFKAIKSCISPSVTTNINSILNSQQSITAYPNPTTGQLTIKLDALSETPLTTYTIKIITILGEVILSETTNNQYLTLNIFNFSNGIYFIKVYQNQQLIGTTKLIKE